jgi:ParB family transcriptional regulator, chromosome partitioning protein
LIDGSNGVVAGHARVEAAKRMGMTDVPCIELSGLSEAQKKAYVIADNKLALNAGWDEDLLKIELTDLKDFDFNLELIGFDGEELADIMYGPDFGPTGADEQGRLDQKSPIKCPSCGVEFIP